MPSAIIPLLKLAKAIPNPFDMFFRSFLMSLFQDFLPPLKPYGGLVEFDPKVDKCDLFRIRTVTMLAC
jgi:hypothetical protein